MLTYLRYLAVPRKKPIHPIEVISRDLDCLAFRCKQDLEIGNQRLGLRTSRGWLSVEIDVYRQDKVSGLYEGRIQSGSARPFSPNSSSQEPKIRSLYGHLQEKFASGVTVRVDQPLATDAFLKVELEDDQGVTDIHLGRILWVRQVKEGKFDVRLSFTDRHHLKKLSKENYLAVS